MNPRRWGIAVFTALLVGCAGPTPYRATQPPGDGFGYTTTQVSDTTYRIHFAGSRKTPIRWIEGYLLYRSAQVAQEANAPAFRIVEGSINNLVLEGEDEYGRAGSEAEFVSAADPAIQYADSVDGRIHKVRTAGIVHSFRPLPPMQKGTGPLIIYTPSGYPPLEPLPVRTILIELRFDLQKMDEKTYVTQDVLRRLGPRIKKTKFDKPARSTIAA